MPETYNAIADANIELTIIDTTFYCSLSNDQIVYSTKDECEISTCSNTNYFTKNSCEGSGNIWTQGEWIFKINYSDLAASSTNSAPRVIIPDIPGADYTFTLNVDDGLLVSELETVVLIPSSPSTLSSPENLYSKVVPKKNHIQLKPELRIYNQPIMVTSEADIRTTLFSDKFLVINLVKGSELFNVRYQIKPFMIWIWISTLLLAIGGIFNLFQRSYEK